MSTGAEARQKQNTKEKLDVKFITTYNPALPNTNKIIKNNLAILYTDENMKKIFPPNTIKTLYILLVITNVIFLRIFLYLTLNPNVRLQVEYIITEVNLLIIHLMLFI